MRHCLLATFLLGLSGTLTAQSNLSFELKRDTANAYSAQAIAQGDFNDDGKPDLVVGGGNAPNDVVLRLGNGDGTFKSPSPIGSTSGAAITDLAAADLNHDGKLDVVALDIEGTVAVFYGNGDGAFESPVSIAASHSPTTLAVADFNGDGFLDIAVGDLNGGVEIFLNDGGKNFTLTRTISLPTTSNPGVLRVRAGDVDANGTIDLAVLTYTSAYVLWGDGHGNFKPVRLATYTAAADLNVGDLNQDGNADIMVTSNCGAAEPFPSKAPYAPCVALDVFYGQGNQTTVHRLALKDNGVNAAQPWAADVNGDGIADIAMGTGTGSAGGLFVWLGHPDGSFDQTPQRFINTSGGGSVIVPGDWNRDGMIDFAQPVPADAETEFYINGGNRVPCATSLINPTVTVCQPVNDTYSPASMHIQATAYDKTSVTGLQQYMDNKEVHSQAGSSFNLALTGSLGPHFLVTKAWDAKGLSFRSNRNITVYSGTPAPACPTALGAASICLPSGASSSSPVHILANGYSSVVPTAAQLYIDNKLVISDAACTTYCPGGSSYVDTFQTLSTGSHDLVFKLWDASGNIYTAQKTIHVE